MALHLLLAVSQIIHTVAIGMLFECVSAAQKWVATTPRKMNMEFAKELRKMLLFAKNGRFADKGI